MVTDLANLKARVEFERKWLGAKPSPPAVYVCLNVMDAYIAGLETTVSDLQGRVKELEADLAMRKIVPDAGKELPL